MKSTGWMSTISKRTLPPYEKKVLLCRPNKTTGTSDVIIGKLARAKPEGANYGKLGEERLTFDDYWVIPSRVLRFDRITYWMELPEPPNI